MVFSVYQDTVVAQIQPVVATPDSEEKLVAQAILNWKENRMERKFVENLL